MPNPTSNKGYIPTGKDFAIPPKDWEFAKDFFKDKPSGTKLEKKHKGTLVSFIKVEDQIYAIAANPKDEKNQDTALLGRGGTSKLKWAKTEDGRVYALKISGGAGKSGQEFSENAKREFEISKKAGILIAAAARDLEQAKQYRDLGEIAHKTYTILELIPGKELLQTIMSPPDENGMCAPKNLPPQLTNILAVKIIEALKELHDKRIIHGDIKPQNILLDYKIQQDKDGKKSLTEINITLIDFGYSLELPEGVDSVQFEKRGSPGGYTAPEVIGPGSLGQYSFQSDWYALMAIFNNDLFISFPYKIDNNQNAIDKTGAIIAEDDPEYDDKLVYELDGKSIPVNYFIQAMNDPQGKNSFDYTDSSILPENRAGYNELIDYLYYCLNTELLNPCELVQGVEYELSDVDLSNIAKEMLAMRKQLTTESPQQLQSSKAVTFTSTVTSTTTDTKTNSKYNPEVKSVDLTSKEVTKEEAKEEAKEEDMSKKAIKPGGKSGGGG